MIRLRFVLDCVPRVRVESVVPVVGALTFPDSTKERKFLMFASSPVSGCELTSSVWRRWTARLKGAADRGHPEGKPRSGTGGSSWELGGRAPKQTSRSSFEKD